MVESCNIAIPEELLRRERCRIF